jgi:hypothetical protein
LLFVSARLPNTGASQIDMPIFAPQPTNTITCPKSGTVLEVKEKA